jgi:hypothetical protein
MPPSPSGPGRGEACGDARHLAAVCEPQAQPLPGVGMQRLPFVAHRLEALSLEAREHRDQLAREARGDQVARRQWREQLLQRDHRASQARGRLRLRTAVQADADHRQGAARGRPRLDQHPAELGAARHQVVRPLQRHVARAQPAQRPRRGDADRERQPRALAQAAGEPHPQREGQARAARREPAPPAPPAPRGLQLGGEQHRGRAVLGEQQRVGRGTGIDDAHLEIVARAERTRDRGGIERIVQWMRHARSI